MEHPEDNWHQNIEVAGSHFGMPYNPSIWTVIEDRLRLSQKDWKAFEKKEYSNDLIYFPSL